MQISKLSVAICATLVSVFPLVIHADTEAQAKAREALEKAMSQPAPQITNNPAAMPKAAKPQKPAPAPTPAPALAAQPAAKPVSAAPVAKTTSTPPVLNTPPPMNADAAERARAALRQKMAEEQSQPAPVAAASGPAPKPQPNQTTYVPPPAVHPPGHPKTQPPGPPPVARTAIQAPALPISATKEAQLQELLVRYKADQISPEDYHKERAKILSGP